MVTSSFGITLSRSNTLLIYLTAIHSVMLIMLLSFVFTVWWVFGLVLITVFSFINNCQHHQWLGKHKSIIKIERNTDDEWRLFYGSGKQRSKLKLTGSFINPQLSLLHFSGKHRWQYYSVILLADAVDTELFRQLRVYCRDPKTFQK